MWSFGVSGVGQGRGTWPYPGRAALLVQAVCVRLSFGLAGIRATCFHHAVVRTPSLGEHCPPSAALLAAPTTHPK